jgi:hypothetical protein
MGEILYAVFGGLFLVLLSLLGIEKKKAEKERKAREEAEAQRDRLRVMDTINRAADEIKDDLASKQRQVDEKQKGVIKSISDIPPEKEVPLSEDVKKMAADQSARARARADGVPDKNR